MIASTFYLPHSVPEVSQVPSLLMLVPLGVAGDGVSVVVVLPLGWQVPLLNLEFSGSWALLLWWRDGVTGWGGLGSRCLHCFWDFQANRCRHNGLVWCCGYRCRIVPCACWSWSCMCACAAAAQLSDGVVRGSWGGSPSQVPMPLLLLFSFAGARVVHPICCC